MTDITPESHVNEIVGKFTKEQQSDYFNTCANIDAFAREMKIRFAEKTREGKSGYRNNKSDIPAEISKRVERLKQGEQRVDISIANWAFINWFNR